MSSVSAAAAVLALRLRMSLARLSKRSIDHARLLVDEQYTREVFAECRSLRHPDLDTLVSQLETLFGDSRLEAEKPAAAKAELPPPRVESPRMRRDPAAADSSLEGTTESRLPEDTSKGKEPTDPNSPGRRYLRGAR